MHATCTFMILRGARAPLCCMCKDGYMWRAKWSMSRFAQGGHADLGNVTGWEVHEFAGQGFTTQQELYIWSVLYCLRSTHTAVVTIVC